jgi:hypothetical protein
MAITFLMKSSASSGYMSMKPRPGTCPTGIVSTMNTIFSRGWRHFDYSEPAVEIIARACESMP